jgi:hypothetical protein
LNFLACTGLAKEKVGSELQMGRLDDTEGEDCLELSMGVDSHSEVYDLLDGRKEGGK